nr:AraC family transcriptional regulator [uncultured Holophaga sp.]
MALDLTLPSSTSAPGVREFVSRDPRQASAYIRQAFTRHQMRVLGTPRAFQARIQTLHLGSIRLSALAFDTEVELAQDPDPRYLLISTQTQGDAEVSYADRTYRGGSGMVVIDSPYAPVLKRFSADSRRIHLRFDTTAVETCCARLLGHSLDRPIHFSPFIPDAAATHRHWLALLQLLLTYVEGDGGRLNPALVRSLEDTALVMLLSEHEHSYSEELRSPASWAPGHIRRAEAFMRAHAGEPLSLAAIADATGISLRGLTQGFRDYRHTSPMRFLQALRLEGARRELLEASPGATVAGIAQAWGCPHLGRFASAYRERFGESPSETLRS